ncbi:MAG: hypothetical protein ACP5US_12715, partial [Candidatus Kryptoniota bacterium]
QDTGLIGYELMGDVINTVAPPESRPQIIDRLQRAGIHVVRFWTEEPSLEYVYEQLINAEESK